jgi:hypothetical protein
MLAEATIVMSKTMQILRQNPTRFAELVAGG